MWLRVTVSSLNISSFLQTLFVADAHLTVGQLFALRTDVEFRKVSKIPSGGLFLTPTLYCLKGKDTILNQVVPMHAIQAYGGTVVKLHSFLTSALDGGELSLSRSGRFMSGKQHLAPF
jgi:hypothetical protein